MHHIEGNGKKVEKLKVILDIVLRLLKVLNYLLIIWSLTKG